MEVKTEVETSCKLCFKSLGGSADSVLIDDGVLEILSFLVSRLNSPTLHGAPICSTCITKLHEAYNFKTLHLDCSMNPPLQNVKIKTRLNASEIEPSNDDHPSADAVFIKQESSEDVKMKGESKVCYICKKNFDGSNYLSLFDILEGNNMTEVIGYLIPESDLQIVEDPVTCIVCQNTLLKLSDILNLLSICEHTVCDNLEKDSKVDIKEESSDPYLVCLSDTQSDLAVAKSNCSKNETGDYKQFQFKNEEIDLKMESDQKDSEGKLDQNSCGPSLWSPEKSKPVKNHKCLICNYQTKFKSALKTHILIHKRPDEVYMYKCSICTFQSKYNISLKKHMRRHNNLDETEKFECEICKHQTNRKDNLKTHMRIHNEIKTYKCKVCPFQTKYKENLKFHGIRHKHPDEAEIYKCPNCKFRTKHMKGLKCHLLCHKNPNEVTKFKCQVCGYQTKYKGNLKHHMLRHIKSWEKKLYTCHICKYQTKYKSTFKTHIISHKISEKIKTYMCEICSIEIENSENFNSHMEMHRKNGDIQLHKCQICAFFTKNVVGLTLHMRIHEN